MLVLSVVDTNGTPSWRRSYNAVERALEPRLRAVLRDDRFSGAVGVGIHVQQAARKRAASSTRRLLHAFNLPAGTDVTRILNEIGGLKRQVHDLRAELERQALSDVRPREVRPGGAADAGSPAPISD